MTDEHDLGSLGEEAAKLLGAAQEWVQRVSEKAPIATGAPECEVCPVCQLIAVVRGDRPDLVEKIGDTARTVVNALLAALAAPHTHARSDASPGATNADRAASGRVVQRIDLMGRDGA
ncbi:MAG: hypothetical protein JWM76_699 [Pseudonocardiales bacterium]|nr:hypothetical protein [Pseudonocardiales bacterium]